MHEEALKMKSSFNVSMLLFCAKFVDVGVSVGVVVSGWGEQKVEE